jgi:hypothetical protein
MCLNSKEKRPVYPPAPVGGHRLPTKLRAGRANPVRVGCTETLRSGGDRAGAGVYNAGESRAGFDDPQPFLLRWRGAGGPLSERANP